MVNPSTGRALSFKENWPGLSLIQQDYDKTNDAQIFKFSEEGRLESVKYPGKFLTANSNDSVGVQCLEGRGLELLAETDRAQEWRMYKYGLANVACGPSKGNLTVTAIKDVSFKNIAYLEHVSFAFVNPFQKTAISVGQRDFATKAELADAVDKYISQGCKDRSDCGIGQRYGWPINSWDVRQIRDMTGLFKNKNFNEEIGSWDVTSVTTMREMFEASSFNQDISGWSIARVHNMDYMFRDASTFSQNLCAWRPAEFQYKKSKDIFLGTKCNIKKTPTGTDSVAFCHSCRSISPTVSGFVSFLVPSAVFSDSNFPTFFRLYSAGQR